MLQYIVLMEVATEDRHILSTDFILGYPFCPHL
jgi:hypothetical protein